MKNEEQIKKLDAMAKPRSEEAIKKAEERKKQRSKLIQDLQDYFDNTSPKRLEQDWKELEQFNQYGPDVEECLKLGRQHCIEMMKDEDLSLK